jgi:hypothetical protein
MLGCARYGYHKKHVRTHYFELVFLHLVQSACDVLRSDASGAQNVDTVVFMLGWAWCRNHKSVPRHVMMNLCFCIRRDLRVLYCILVHWGHKMSMHYFSCLSGVGTDSTKSASRDVTSNLCFCIWCDLRARSAFGCIGGAKRRHTIFHAQVGPVRISQKARRDTLRRICVFCILCDLWVM